MPSYDYLIVGSGLFGSTFAYLARQQGKRCLVIDRRSHLGGNVYCKKVRDINVHVYGPHIFHTSNREVWEFVNRFVAFNHYRHCPLARYGDRLYNLPFNMNTLCQMWEVNTPDEAKAEIEKQRYRGEVSTLEQQALSLVGRDIYETLIKGYTEKQWGCPCTELPPFIIRRLPVRYTFDNNYFNDTYQGIPIGGYNQLIKGMLEGIEVRLNCDFLDMYADHWRSIAKCLVYTGKIDDFYGCCHGKLAYRTMRFETQMLETPDYQGVSQMNYTSGDVPYTRIVEHKHFESFGDDVQITPYTVISKEYPEEYASGKEAYYPINNEENNRKHARYKELAAKEPDVIFGGRLAAYWYYDMDDTIAEAMKFWQSSNL